MAGDERPTEAHPQSPSAKWAAFARELHEHATRSADELAARHRERVDGTEYHQRAEHDERTAEHG